MESHTTTSGHSHGPLGIEASQCQVTEVTVAKSIMLVEGLSPKDSCAFSFSKRSCWTSRRDVNKYVLDEEGKTEHSVEIK